MGNFLPILSPNGPKINVAIKKDGINKQMFAYNIQCEVFSEIVWYSVVWLSLNVSFTLRSWQKSELLWSCMQTLSKIKDWNVGKYKNEASMYKNATGSTVISAKSNLWLPKWRIMFLAIVSFHKYGNNWKNVNIPLVPEIINKYIISVPVWYIICHHY